MKTASADRRDFIRYPMNRVVGTVDDAGKAGAAVEALLQAGFNREDIDVLHGEGDLHRLDPTGAEHGLLAQVQRTLIRTLELEEFKHLTHYVDDIRAGRFVIMVRTRPRMQRIVAADILHRHGAEFVGFYGRWACEELPATARLSPEDIPAAFARAWNARDADALASLFEDDAEYVNVLGLCWHGRESIRQAHADGLERVFTRSLLSAGETKLKLLSPDVAVVHARMTMSDGDGAGEVAHSGRTKIVSFVVHRTGDRWRCASAHTTDVSATTETPLVDQAGAVGLASYPGDQLS